MKKVLGIIVSLMVLFMFVGTGLAGSYIDSGTNATAGSNYRAKGYFCSFGDADAKVYNPMGDGFSGNNVAGVYSGQKVKSDAWAFAPIPKRPYQRAEAYGDTYQWTEAGVRGAPGTWAAGGQESGSGYHSVDHGFFSADAEGNACTIGGTLVGAKRWDTRRSSTAVAGGVVGSMGHAGAGCDYKDTWTWGSGGVDHATYANKGAGEAWTGGSASYNYQTNGRSCSYGSGMAGTFGVSRVTYTRTGITASSFSKSFSTSGPTSATGGVHISR